MLAGVQCMVSAKVVKNGDIGQGDSLCFFVGVAMRDVWGTSDVAPRCGAGWGGCRCIP